MLPPPRTVIFDLDGTLMDSLPFVLRSLQYAVEPFTTQQLTMDLFPLLGGPPERFLAQLVGDPRHVPAALRRLEDFHATHGFQLEPFEGVPAILGALRAAGLALAIWTGRDRLSTTEVLARHQLTDYFVQVVCGDDYSTHKPDPQGLQEILRRLGSRPQDALFLGDSDVDVEAGHAAGVPTILIQHRREVPAAVRGKAWRIVPAPVDGYRLALDWAGLTAAG